MTTAEILDIVAHSLEMGLYAAAYVYENAEEEEIVENAKQTISKLISSIYMVGGTEMAERCIKMLGGADELLDEHLIERVSKACNADVIRKAGIKL